MSSITSTPIADGASQTRSRVKAILAACSGNLIEWFDFFSYAYTSNYFASSFFPKGDETSQLLQTAGIFAIGFFMRPLGGWLFGWIADTKGRRLSMMISILMMCFGSLMIAVLPTYAAIGMAAPILLLVARMLQGLSVGAEYGTGATYLSEVATAGKRGFYSSLQYTTILAGQLLALLVVVSLQQIFSADELKAWAWRVPFLIGSLGAIVVLYLRRHMHESANTEELAQEGSGSLGLLWRHRKAMFLVIFITCGCTLFFYTFTTYMQKFLVVSAGLKPDVASMIMTVALTCAMFLQPLFGALADRIGVRTNMLIFSGLAAICAPFLLFAIRDAKDPYVAFGLVLTGLLIACFYMPISGLVKAELFPARIRALGVGFPYAIATGLFGGSAEYVALSLRSAGIESYYFYYVAAMAAVVFIASWCMPNLTRYGYLDGTGEIETKTGLFRRT